MPWITCDERPDPSRWRYVRAQAPGEAHVSRGWECRACGWVCLARSTPSSHECLGRRRDWSGLCTPRVASTPGERDLGGQPVPAGGAAAGGVAPGRRVA